MVQMKYPNIEARHWEEMIRVKKAKEFEKWQSKGMCCEKCVNENQRCESCKDAEENSRGNY